VSLVNRLYQTVLLVSASPYEKKTANPTVRCESESLLSPACAMRCVSEKEEEDEEEEEADAGAGT
jgi:hypothetical protein